MLKCLATFCEITNFGNDNKILHCTKNYEQRLNHHHNITKITIE